MSFQTLPSLADILAADRQLACEVEYDLRMFENQQTEDAEQAPANPAQVPGCKQLGGGGVVLWCHLMCLNMQGSISQCFLLQKLSVKPSNDFDHTSF